MENAITYRTKSFIINNMAVVVIIMMQAGFGVMFLMFMMGFGQWTVTAAFLGVMVFMAMLLGGETIYTISEKGISKKVTPMLLKGIGVKREENYTWSDIDWYKSGKDMNREMREFRYLTIKFKGFGKQWKIADKNKNDSAFETFHDSFIKIVEAYDQSVETVGARMISKGKVFDKTGIKKRKTFYETIIAKGLAIFTTLLLVGLVIFYYLNIDFLNFSNLTKLLIVVIPGWAYLNYRVFFRKE